MSFKYDLPDGCPKESVCSCGDREVLRLVNNDKVTENDFKSFYEEGRKKPVTACVCKYHAVSYFDVGDKQPHAIAKGLTALPGLKKYDYFVTIMLKEKDGMILETDPGRKNRHISLWEHKTFDPIEQIVTSPSEI